MKQLLFLFALLFSASATAQCNFTLGPDQTICSGSNVLLGNSLTYNSAWTYTWSPAAGLSASDTVPVVAAPAATTTYTLTIDDNAGCTYSSDITVTVNPAPAAGFTFNPATACAGIPVQFSSTSTGSGLTYSWNFGNPASGSANTSTQQNPVHAFVSTGAGTQLFTVTLTVTNSNGCSSTVTQPLTITQSPGAALLDPLTDMKNCDGSNFNMQVYDQTASAANSNYQIIWGDGTADYNASSAPSPVSHLYSTSDIFDLYYIVTGNNGCIDTAHYVVSNITNPAIGAANPGGTTGCGPISLCFPLNNFGANHPSTFYVVDYGDNSPKDTLPHPPPASICHTYTQTSCGQPGNAYIFRIKAINRCDSSEATITPIRIYTAPEASFNIAPNPGCVGSPITMSNASTLGSNSSCSSSTVFNWNFGDGQTATTLSLSSPVHTYSTPGTYTITLSTSNSCGSTTHTETVCIEAPPTPQFTLSPSAGCIPLNTSANNTSNLSNTCNVTRSWSVIFNGSTCLPSTGTWSFAGGTNASSLNPQFTFSSPGIYTVRLTLTNSCGFFTYDQTVTAQSPPQVSVSGLSDICAGGGVNPAGSVNNCYEPTISYSWSFPGGSPSTASSLNPGTVNYATAGSFTLTLTATNQCGTASGSTPLTVKPLPPPLNPAVNTPLCEGQTANFTSSAVTGVTYSWNGPSGSFTGQNFSIPSVSSANAGTYTLTGTLNGCPGTPESVTLVVQPMPVVSVTPSSASVCTGQSVVLTASGAASYTWSPSAGLSGIIGSNVTATPSTSTTYTITGSNGTCSAAATALITVNPLPLVNAGNDTTLCNQPVPVTLVATPSGGSWSGPNVDAGGTFTPNGTGSFTLVYTFTDANGCTNTDSTVVSVINPTPASAGPDFSVCLDAPNVTLNGNPAAGTWTGSGVSSGGIFDPTAAGSFELVYSTGAGSCLSRDTLLAVVYPLPAVDAGTDFAVCILAGDQVLSATPVGGTWSGTAVSGGNFSPSTAGAGTFTLSYTYTDGNGCSASDQLLATVNPLPLVNAGNDTTLCNQPVPVTLVATPSGGSWSGPNVDAGGTFTPNGTGSFTLVYTFTDANGCTNTDSTVVSVINPTPASAGPDFSVCLDAPNVTLNGNPAAGTWTGSGVSSGGVFDPTAAGSFELVYSTGAGSCLSRDTLLAVVYPLPAVDAGTDFAVCILAGDQVLSATPVGGTWSGTAVSGVNFSPSTAGAGTFTLSYIYTDGNGCSASDQLLATVNPLPLVNAGNDTTLCNQPVPVTLVATPSGGSWSGPNVDAGGTFTPNGTGSFTLVYTFTDANGCTNTDSTVVSVINPTPASAGPDFAVCLDAPNVTLNGNPAAGTWTGSGVSPGGVFDPTAAGSFELVYSTGSGSCLSRDTLLAVVYPLPAVDAGIDTGFCPANAPVTLSGSPAGGMWAGPGITNASTGDFDPGIPATGAHVITYTYTDAATGCSSSDQLTITIHSVPVPDFNYNPVTCTGTPESLTDASTSGSTWAWNFGDGTTSNSSNPSHTWTGTGFFTISEVVTSAFGCIDSISHVIEVREPPVASIALTPDSACGPLIASFTNNSTGPSVSYSWNFGNGNSSTAQFPGPETYAEGYLADTVYTVMLTATNFCGSDSDSKTVTVMPHPHALFGTNTDIGCSPLTLNFANNSTGLPDNYTWDLGDGATSNTTAANFNHVYTTGTDDTTYTIELVVSNECGSDTMRHSITVLSNQVNAFFNTDSPDGCVPHTVNFTQFSTGATVYDWDFGDGNVAATPNAAHTFTSPGTYTVQLFVNDGCGYDTASVVITVYPSPVVDFSSQPDSVCIGVDFVFNNLSGNLASSDWNFGDGGTSTLYNPVHAFDNPGTYTVTLTGTSQTNGCVSTASHPVIVSTNPVAAFTPSPANGCKPLPVQFQNASTNGSFQSWDFGDGNVSTGLNPQHTYLSDGNYTVTLVVENVNGCKDTVQSIVTVYPLPVASFSMLTGNTCYPPTDVTFTNGSTGAMNYQWDLGNGNASNLTDPADTYAAGQYVISMIASNQYGCLDTAIQTLTVYETPVAAFTLPDDTLCVGEMAVFLSTSTFADSIVWNFGNGESLTGSQVNYLYPGSGTFPVTIMAYGAGGCGDTLTLNTNITVNPTPIAGFAYENVQNPDPLSGIVVFSNSSQFADQYTWYFGNGDTSTVEDPTERYNSYGEFLATLIASNQYGCSDTAVETVKVEFFYGLFIPNAMEPGNSNFEVANFIPKGVGLAEFELLIYDDWGNLIWETHALDSDGRPTEYWDGTFNGVDVQQDAYVWKCTATFANHKVWEGKEYGNRIKRSGTVTVIR